MLAYLTCDLDRLPAKSVGGFPELCAIHMWSLHKASLMNPNSYHSETNLLVDKNSPVTDRGQTDRQCDYLTCRAPAFQAGPNKCP